MTSGFIALSIFILSCEFSEITLLFAKIQSSAPLAAGIAIHGFPSSSQGGDKFILKNPIPFSPAFQGRAG